MTTTKIQLAEDVSSALRKALPVASAAVDRYRELAVWDQAIIESLAAFADVREPLPSDVRDLVQELLDEPGVSPKLRKRCLYHLDRLPH